MPFFKKLKSNCSNCKAATVKVYFNAIKRLLKLFNNTLEEIPLGSKWLMTDKLMKAVKKVPLGKRRHLSSAAYKATKVYKLKSDNKWLTQMKADIADYEAARNKNQRSAHEIKNLPKSLNELKKAAREFKKRISRVYAKDKPNLADLFKIQKWLILRLAYAFPFRSDLASINLEKQTGNYLVKNKKGFNIILTDFKASDKIGEKTIRVKKPEVTVLKTFLKFREKAGVDHDFLLTARSGKPMSRRSFSQILSKTTEELLGKKVGPRILRVLFATEHKDVLDKAREVQELMLHGNAKQTKQYTRNK